MLKQNKMRFGRLTENDRSDVQIARMICAVYGDGTIAERTVRKW